MATIKCNPTTFEATISKLIQEYGDKVKQVPEEAVKKIAKETIKELEKTAPVNTGEYAKGFAARYDIERFGACTAHIWNPKKYRITHLLEDGHVIVYFGHRTGRMSRKFPHWNAANEKAQKALEEEFVKRIESID